jgi:transcriptional regulator with XRE-family HTH domain
MIKDLWAQLLAKMDDYSKQNQLTRRELAQQLGIPYNTYREWFQKTEHEPSKSYVNKIQHFLLSKKETESTWKELWIKILSWRETQHQYKTTKELAEKIGWDTQSLSHYFLTKDIPPKLVIEKMANIIGLEAPDNILINREAYKRIEKIKYLLIILEEELSWFRDGSVKARDELRSRLNLDDVGYISSLLTMLGDEGRFKRWLALTTNRFNFFAKKGGQG